MMEVALAIRNACSLNEYAIWATTTYFVWLYLCRKKHNPDEYMEMVEIDRAVAYLDEYNAARISLCCINPLGVKVGDKVWEPHPLGVYRLDVDAAVDLDKNMLGYGAVVRDWNGEIEAAMAVPGCRLTSVFDAELIAFLFGLCLCYQEGYGPVEIYSDSLTLVRMVTDKMDSGLELDDEFTLIFEAFNAGVISKFKHVYRCANVVAHALAQFGARSDNLCTWNSNYPL